MNSRFKKLFLIPQEELDALRQEVYENKFKRDNHDVLPSYNKSKRYDVERELDDVLTESSLTDREKWLKYTQIFDKFKRKLSEKGKPLEINIKKEKKPVEKYPGREKIVDDLSWIDKRKIFQVFQHLKDSEISWNEAGEVYIRHEKLNNSNINNLSEDLLEYSGEDPIGWKEFYTELHRSNFPLQLIGNDGRQEFIKNLDSRAITPELRQRRDISQIIKEFSDSPSFKTSRRRNPKRHVRRLKESPKSVRKLITKKWQGAKL
jgi:hypothetical protein